MSFPRVTSFPNRLDSLRIPDLPGSEGCVMYYKIINKRKRIVTAVADLFGHALWGPFNLLANKGHTLTDIKEILVIRTAYIGDVVMTLPILKPLRELYPEARITFLTSSYAQEILENNPYVDEVLAYDAFWFYPAGIGKGIVNHINFLKTLRSRRYDLVIEARADIRDILLLAYLSRSKYRVSYKVGGGGFLLTHVVPFERVKHKVEYHLDLVRFLGGRVNEIEWGIYLRPEEKRAAKTILLGEGIDDSDLVVGIHPAGRKVLKSWPPRNLAKLANRLIAEHGAKVVLTGSVNDKALIAEITTKIDGKVIDLAGKTTLRLLSGLIERFNLFICSDTAPMHVAAAVKTPTVAIFGPSKSMETGPYAENCRVVEKDFACRFTCDEDVCNHRVHNACMTSITPDDVYDAARELITTTRA